VKFDTGYSDVITAAFPATNRLRPPSGNRSLIEERIAVKLNEKTKVQKWTHVPRFRIYDLRHIFGTRLAESGADPFTIMKIMGHSSISTSQTYVHPTPERLEDAFTSVQANTLRRRQDASAASAAS